MKTYYESGNVKSISEWKNGIQDGVAKLFFENGSLNILVNWDNGIKNGEFIKQDSLGRVLKKGDYNNAKFDGEKFNYDSVGNLTISHFIKHGLPLYYEQYYGNGTKEKWFVKFTLEEVFIDINKDTLLVNDTLKVKFIVNHLLADSMRIFEDDFRNGKLLFRWPEEKNIKHIQTISSNKVGWNNYYGDVVVYYKSDLDTLAGEKRIYPFIVKFFMKSR